MSRSSEARASVGIDARSDSTPARLLIADDHALLRTGMRTMLEAEPDLAVVGDAGDGREAVDDTASFAGSATRISASLISGFAQRLGTNPLQGVAMVGVENLTGSGLNDVLEGSSAANKLVDGGKGTDTCTTDRAEKLITRCE